MTISKVVNKYASIYSPYASGLVNHLPMGQLALYKMGNDLEKIELYSENYASRGRLDPVKLDYIKAESIAECLGKRDLYESCLELVKAEIELKGADIVIKEILNAYPLGISSGLFHTPIRLAYAVEGLAIDKDYIEEVARSLAYYVTAYREGKVFQRKVKPSVFKEDVKALFTDQHIDQLLESKSSTGQKLHALYSDKEYLEKAPLIDGTIDEKVETLIRLILPIFDNTNNIIALHCITGLHAIVVLQSYFNDFQYVLDIMTSYIITHLLTADRDSKEADLDFLDLDWNKIIQKASNSTNVHTIKYIYSAGELFKRTNIEELTGSAALRTERN